MRAARTALLLALVLGGCAQNSVLELTLRMRSADEVGAPGATDALLDFHSTSATRSADVLASELSTVTIPLSAPGGVQRVSVVASGEDIETPLWLSVRYCGGGVPCGVDVPRAWFRFERAFYVGEFTEYELAMPDRGAPDFAVGTCDVSGCVPGTTSGCTIDGIHWCEG